MGSPNEISNAPSGATLDLASEKTGVVTHTDADDFSKDVHIDDEAGVVAVKALASGPADVEISRRVLRKIDFYILPFLCITYGM
jgi:pyridoxal biosynthesis lyase PdxS